jgi:hypothetical protein
MCDHALADIRDQPMVTEGQQRGIEYTGESIRNIFTPHISWETRQGPKTLSEQSADAVKGDHRYQGRSRHPVGTSSVA